MEKTTYNFLDKGKFSPSRPRLQCHSRTQWTVFAPKEQPNLQIIMKKNKRTILQEPVDQSYFWEILKQPMFVATEHLFWAGTSLRSTAARRTECSAALRGRTACFARGKVRWMQRSSLESNSGLCQALWNPQVVNRQSIGSIGYSVFLILSSSYQFISLCSLSDHHLLAGEHAACLRCRPVRRPLVSIVSLSLYESCGRRSLQNRPCSTLAPHLITTCK